MVFVGYAISLAVWLAWIYFHYNHGDRPTSYAWFVAMLALGGFEYGKGIVSFLVQLPTYAQAGITAVILTVVVLGYQSAQSQGTMGKSEELSVGAH
ncbi:MAG: hypothetical protein ACE5E4_12185 [Candidatus Binatia bacterium]